MASSPNGADATSSPRTATMPARSSPTWRRTWCRTGRTSSGYRMSPTSPTHGGSHTSLAIPGGFLYLAAILDAWSRKVVGYAISRSMDARVAVAALKAAIKSREPARGCIHHSDRGSQGGFTRSSQHRGGGVVRWRVGGARIELYGES